MALLICSSEVRVVEVGRGIIRLIVIFDWVSLSGVKRRGHDRTMMVVTYTPSLSMMS